MSEVFWFQAFKVSPELMHTIGLVLHAGTPQGLHNMQGSYNVPNMSGTHLPRNSTINVVPSGSMQQSTGNFLTGRVGSNNIPSVFSQVFLFFLKVVLPVIRIYSKIIQTENTLNVMVTADFSW